MTITNNQSAPLSIAEFKARWIDVRNHGGKNIVFNTCTGDIMKKTEFCRGHVQPIQLEDGTYKKISTLMQPENQQHRTTVDSLIFDPAKPPGLGQDSRGHSYFNRWRGFDLASHAPIANLSSKCSKILEFFSRILGQNGEDELNYLIWSLAWNLQNPGKKPGVAIIFFGEKGSGKSTYGEICFKLFAPYSVVLESAHLVFDRFNASLDCMLFILLEEAFWARGGKHEDRAKHLITSDRITIERKGIDPIATLSFHRLTSLTNHAHAAPASLDERRYAVFEINKIPGWTEADWTALYAEIDGEGLIAFYQYLQSFRMGAWHPARNIPQNSALARQKVFGLNGTVDGFVLSCLQNEAIPQSFGSGGNSTIEWNAKPIVLDRNNQEALLASANKWLNSQHAGRYEAPWTWQKLLVGLKKLGAAKMRVNGNTATQWNIPNHNLASQNFAIALDVPVAVLKS